MEIKALYNAGSIPACKLHGKRRKHAHGNYQHWAILISVKLLVSCLWELCVDEAGLVPRGRGIGILLQIILFS